MVVLRLLSASQAAVVVGDAGPTDPLGPAAHLFALLFLVTLAAVAWLETRPSALLVVLMGLGFFAAELSSAVLNLSPQYGNQGDRLAFAGLTIVIALFGILNYRRLSGPDRTPSD